MTAGSVRLSLWSPAAFTNPVDFRPQDEVETPAGAQGPHSRGLNPNLQLRRLVARGVLRIKHWRATQQPHLSADLCVVDGRGQRSRTARPRYALRAVFDAKYSAGDESAELFCTSAI